jgi:hypothetical protein
MDAVGPTEHELLDAVASGALVDRRSADDREVRAESLVELATTGSPRALRLAGARITGDLDFAELTLVCPVQFEACAFEGRVSFTRASAPRIGLLDCHLATLAARQLKTAGDVILNGLTAEQVVLTNAVIGGRLTVGGARLQAAGASPALDGDGLVVHQGMFCRRLRAVGEVRLFGASIDGSLTLSGAELAGTPALAGDGLHVRYALFCDDGFKASGEVRLTAARIAGVLTFAGATLEAQPGDHQPPALNADAIEVDQSAHFSQGFRATGGIRLLDARIGGVLTFAGASLAAGEAPYALAGDRMRVDQNLHFTDGFEAKGRVHLPGVRIGNQLVFAEAALGEPDELGVSLVLQRAKATELFLPRDFAPEGRVDLTAASVSRLDDRWDPDFRYPVRIGDFRYETLTGTDDVESRLSWIEAAEGDEQPFIPQAYDQLMSVYRHAGRDEDARTVAIAKERRRRKTLKAPGKAWSLFLDATVGFGYRTWQAVYALIALVLVGWGVFAWASWDHLVETKAEGRPPFQPLLYSIDAVLPVIDLGQETAWAATGAAQAWYALSVLAGWILSLGLIAALTSSFFRE